MLHTHTHLQVAVAPAISALNWGVAIQVASWKVSQYRGVSRLHCRLSRYSGPLRERYELESRYSCFKIA